MNLFDSHSHYNDEKFDIDREQIIKETLLNGVSNFIIAGYNIESSKKAIEIAQDYEQIYTIAGISPNDVEDIKDNIDESIAQIEEIAKSKKVVAIGEIGLDYYWDNESHDVQKQWFIRQLELARELDLPVSIHSREAAADTLAIMKEHAIGLRGVIHCFSYSLELAREYVKMGFYIGVGGVVTFKNGRKLKEIVEEIPLDKILLETDCPYLAPVPYRGKRNDSSYLSYVAEEIARIKGITVEEVISTTEENAKQLFGI